MKKRKSSKYGLFTGNRVNDHNSKRIIIFVYVLTNQHKLYAYNKYEMQTVDKKCTIFL